MAKNYWLYPEKWRNQDEAKGECLVLGGEYSVWKIDGRSIYLQDNYGRFEFKNTVSIHDLDLVEAIEICKFKAGDLIKPSNAFDSECFKRELKSFYSFYFNGMEASGNHLVTSVLNNYYIFIDVEQNSDYAFPFYCNDFEKVS
jgi:hypothetical protein